MTEHRTGPCVVGWSVISPFGVGRQSFATGLSAMPATPRPARNGGCVIADFDAPTLIGTRGTRTLDRLTTMVIATTTLVLGSSGSMKPSRLVRCSPKTGWSAVSSWGTLSV